MYKNQLRFALERQKIILNDISKKEQESILAKLKFVKIYRTMLEKPNFIKTDKLSHELLESSHANYDYILKMNQLDLNKNGVQKLQDLIKELETNELFANKESDAFLGASAWLAELDKLEAIIQKGHTTNWQAWDVKALWAD
jgi:hypothetical protein